jgi:oxygen-independent coproporphyrinogen-3 oxidase
MAPLPVERSPALGIYVHFPWCIKKCPYCDFHSLATEGQAIPEQRYTERVLEELDARGAHLHNAQPRSLFFGGGTPSLWSAERIAQVVRRVRELAGSEAPFEVTVECNPGSFDEDYARALVDAGVNRVSVGVQSLSPEILKFLGRLHTPEEALSALRAAFRAGLERVSGDLIFGVHGQLPRQAADEARQLADLGLTHLSAYALTIEPKTRFGAEAQKGRLPLLSDDTVAEAFLAVHRELESQGFEHYEISNFARDGHYSVHNLGYWLGENYLGVGSGAWGTLELAPGERARYRNTLSVDRYLGTPRGDLAADLQTGLVTEFEPLDRQTLLTERLLLGLRLRQGVDLGRAGRELGIDPWTRERTRSVERLTSTGRLARDGNRLYIPQSKWLLADGIISSLI